MAVDSDRISCPACGRTFARRPELRGKRVKCKCGNSFTVPEAVAAAAAPAPEPEPFPFDDMGPVDEPITPPDYNPAPITPPAYTPPGRTATATTAAAPKAAAPGKAAAPARARGGKFDDAAAKKAEVKKLITIGVSIALLVGLIFAGRAIIGGDDKPKNYLGLDGDVAKMTDDDGAFEVVEWLKGSPARGVVGYFWTRERTAAKAQEWYNMGAKKVLAFGGVMTRCLAIELPAEKEKREPFFRWLDTLEIDGRKPPGAPQTDVGQRYLVVRFI